MAARSAKKSTRKVTRTPRVVEETTPVETVENFSGSKKPRVRLLFLVVLLLLVLGALVYKFRGQFIVAMVDGRPISRLAVWTELEKEGGKGVMDFLVTRDLVMADASKKKVSVSDDEVNKELSTYENNLKSQNQTLDSALAAQGMTKASFTDQVRYRLLVMKLLADKLTVSDDDVAKYMTDNKLTAPKGTSDSDYKAQISQQLQQQKLSQVFQSYIDGLKSAAKIQYLYNY